MGDNPIPFPEPEGIRTPDGATLLGGGLCDCAIHCSNNCEAAHCPTGTRWCRCWCHSDRYLAMQERIGKTNPDEYDPGTCKTAAELRAFGIAVPKAIPDCAWVPNGSMVVVGEPKLTSVTPNELKVKGLMAVFTVPFRWVEATIAEGEEVTMSTTFSLECPHCGTEVYSVNYTWNISPMWVEAQVFNELKAGGKRGSEIGAALVTGLARMRADPERYRALNPANGWGSYEGALQTLGEIVQAVQAWPECVTRIS